MNSSSSREMILAHDARVTVSHRDVILAASALRNQAFQDKQVANNEPLPKDAKAAIRENADKNIAIANRLLGSFASNKDPKGSAGIFWGKLGTIRRPAR